MRFFSHSAYTLVELLIALTLSLLLLLGIAELFQRVGGVMNESRSGMSASAHMNEAAMLLRNDLRRVDSVLAEKPQRIANNEEPDDDTGYLEIIEGPDHLFISDCPFFDFDPEHRCHPYVDKKGNLDMTVGDVDDIIAFTVTDRIVKFRGWVQGAIDERDSAEIVWFVRGNTLYRRIRLLADDDQDSGDTLEDVALREKRVIHQFYPPDDSDEAVAAFTASSPTNSFPYPLYDPEHTVWYYLRMPILEEIVSKEWEMEADNWQDEHTRQWKTIPIHSAGLNENPDMWESPHFIRGDPLDERSGLDGRSGALKQYVDTPRNPRAGEDVVLTNVLSFDIKVWCPSTKEFVDLGTEGTTWAHGNNNYWDTLPGVWDSWTHEYKNEGPPPYTQRLQAIQITIRCFDPTSQAVKQVTVVHRFEH